MRWLPREERWGCDEECRELDSREDTELEDG